MSLTKVFTKMIADTAISVQSYGAKGDGVTDDSAAINAAIADLGYAYLSPPEVSYYIESPIIVQRGQQVFGNGYGFYYDDVGVTTTPTILVKRGIPAIWVQDFYVEVKDLSIKIDKPDADINDFTNANDVGILIRNPASFPPTATTDWEWVGVVLVENVTIARAYTSINMEAVYRISLNQINTFNDKNGVLYNQAQRANTVSGDLPKQATSMYFQDVYCRGAPYGYTPTVGGFGFWGDTTQGLDLNNCIAENYDQAAYYFKNASGRMTSFHTEGCTKGVRLSGNLSPFIVENPFVYYPDASHSTYAFSGEYGTTVFIGGGATMNNSSTCSFFKPDGPLPYCHFVTLPALQNATPVPLGTPVTDYTSGIYTDESLVVNDSLMFANTITGITTGVPVQITPIPSTADGGGGFVYVTSYTLGVGGGLYQALISFMPGDIQIVFEHNASSSTVAYTTGVNNALYLTSSGSHILQATNVKGMIN